MRQTPLFRQICGAYLLIILLSLLAVSWYATREVRVSYLRDTRQKLSARTRLFRPHLSGQLLAQSPDKVDRLCKELGRASGTRLTVIAVDGTVVGDSDEDPEAMENHGDRPEIRDAIQSGSGWSIRRSDTLDKEMMYAAIPLSESGTVYGVVRGALSMTLLESTLRAIYLRVLGAGVVIALLATALAVWTARRITRPLADLKEGVARFARGDLDDPLPVPASEELAVLARAMNEMAAELDSRIRSILEQRNEQQAVLSSMVEGVIAVDPEERILQLNSAAERILGCTVQSAEGRFIQEVVRNPDLQDFIRQSLEATEPTEGDISWHGGGEDRFFQARGSILRDSRGEKVGVLVVLNEVTRLYRLEQVRRDFVANVSHELRTPITSIRGFAETILDEPAHDPERIRHFAGIIARQASRLNAIIEDLLSLSRIERQAEEETIETHPGPLRPILEGAVQGCQLQAERKRIDLQLDCAPEIRAQINPDLIEQALVNLVDNAVKYSPEETAVRVDCTEDGETIRIRVRDEGPGISREHQSRLFERFYRVDKARSRDMGGTGLGLAIVKHVVLSHGGAIELDSAPGKGSTFTVNLPALPAS